MTAVLPIRQPQRSREDLASIRDEFPILRASAHGHPLVYLDSAASAQKPRRVLDAMRCFYENDYANVHRGVHLLSQRATDSYEEARAKAARFLNARSASEIVFVRGATEGINLVAAGLGRSQIRKGDEILISHLEHHSNIVPWQLLCAERGAVLKVIPVNDDGHLELTALDGLLSERTKVVAVTHISNALGTITPVDEIIRRAHDAGALVLIDGCQAAPHVEIDVQALNADFYAFSSHKVYGPTGIGVLYGKMEHLEALPPYQGGGEMIASVSFERTTYKKPPMRFEAGTPAIAEAIGLGAAIDFIAECGPERIARHEAALLAHATRAVADIPGVHILGEGPKAPILSFVMDGVHPHDIGTILDRQGIAIRAGHHCAQPLMDRFDVAATARASFAVYNTLEDAEALAEGLRKVRKMFG